MLAAICLGFLLAWLSTLGAHSPQSKALWGGGLFFALGVALFGCREGQSKRSLAVARILDRQTVGRGGCTRRTASDIGCLNGRDRVSFDSGARLPAVSRTRAERRD